MARSCCLAGSAVALIVLVAAAPAEARKIGKCTIPRGAQLHERSKASVVFELDSDFEGDTTGDVYGCLRRIGQRVHLTSTYDNNDEWDLVGQFKSAQHYVAWVEDSADHYGNEGREVHAFNLRTRRERWSSPLGVNGGPLSGNRTAAEVDKLVLAPTGHFAYVSGWFTNESNTEQHQVRARDGTGDHTLDQATSIQPRSLNRHGMTITWVDAGQTRSYTFR